MKKIKVVFICFICLYLIAFIYFDVYIKLQSFYWLLAKLIGVVIVFLGVVFKVNKERSKSSYLFSIGIYAIWLVYYGYREISKYKRDICQDKFGLVFNKTRQSLGVPEIPANWHITFRGNKSLEWGESDSTTGHANKYISIDSTCSVVFERDDYDLKPVKGMSRSISIITDYKHGKDSISYDYEKGDDNRPISRQQADSIFSIEKISKDY